MNKKCKNHRIRSHQKQYYGYCTKYKKKVSLFCKCEEIEYKEAKTKKAKNVGIKKIHDKSSVIKKKSYKLTKLEKERFSLFTDDLEHCIICGRSNVNKHEIFFGSKHRQLSIKYGLVIPLCNSLHHNQIEQKGIHFDIKLQNEWKKKGQLKFKETYPGLDFEKIFHRNYLG